MNIFTNNADFYPTPDEVINTMMMGENFIGKTILEPSAGKGNIVDWLKKNGAGKIIACEKDANLKKLLNGKCEMIADDFLTVSSEQISHVDRRWLQQRKLILWHVLVATETGISL